MNIQKSIIIFSILSIIFSGCVSSKKHLSKGRYDAAIEKAVRDLRRNSNDEKQIRILMDSYGIANNLNNERIRYLKLEGRANSWDEIFQIYQNLSSRQSLVSTVMPLSLNGQPVYLQYIDYAPDMVEAKVKAADYYFAHGNQLMRTGQKASYRQAYEEFRKVKQYMGDYPDIDNRINEARYMGISRVYVSVRNNSFIRFPQEFEQDLLAINLQRLNSEWVEYYIYHLNNNTVYDYYINVNINNIAVSPNKISQKESVVKKTVEDGFEYQLDRRGNVMKDSLGNDIRVRKYKTLQCAVIETIQRKSCVISGNVEIIQVNPDRILKRETIRAQSNFEDISFRAIGDIQALSPEMAAQIRRPPAQAPTDIDMVFMSSEVLRTAIRDAIQNNRRYIN